MTMPGFGAESSLDPALKLYGGKSAFVNIHLDGDRKVTPQFRFPATSDPDLGAYLKCIANGGNELVCRFFGGLPPFTIGGRLINR